MRLHDPRILIRNAKTADMVYGSPRCPRHRVSQERLLSPAVAIATHSRGRQVRRSPQRWWRCVGERGAFDQLEPLMQRLVSSVALVDGS